MSFCDPKGESNISTSMKPDDITMNSLIWIIFLDKNTVFI